MNHIWCVTVRLLILQQYHRASSNLIIAGPKQLPPTTDKDYHPCAACSSWVLEEIMSSNIRGCNKVCVKSKLDILEFFHECKGRNHCGKYQVLQHLPKRRKIWQIDNDGEKDEAWGLHAEFDVSFLKVALYHLLILSGPLTFWGMWLRMWPTDWQNASVPFFAVAVLLSLFWLPFAHKNQSREKHKMA